MTAARLSHEAAAPPEAASDARSAPDIWPRGYTATVLSISQSDTWRMIRGRAVVASILAPIGNHTFSATGITA
jgi:hypothetical protein